jgi:lauroyl/myristoyl acyltransferase
VTIALPDPLWWRYRVGNNLLAPWPIGPAYSVAERWGRWRSRALSDHQAFCAGVRDLAAPQLQGSATAIARRYHGLQSRIRLDDHRMAHAPMASVLNQVSVLNADVLTRQAGSNPGLMVLTAHFGRLGMIGPAMRQLGIQTSFLTATVDQRATNLSAVQRWVGHGNAKSLQRFAGGQWIMADDPATRLRTVLRKGEPLMVVIDAFSTRSPEREVFRFGTGTLAIPTGVVRLAEATGAPMALALMHDMEGEKVQMRCWALDASPRHAVQQAFDTLAQSVAAEPWQWWLLPHSTAVWSAAAGEASPAS